MDNETVFGWKRKSMAKEYHLCKVIETYDIPFITSPGHIKKLQITAQDQFPKSLRQKSQIISTKVLTV